MRAFGEEVMLPASWDGREPAGAPPPAHPGGSEVTPASVGAALALVGLMVAANLAAVPIAVERGAGFVTLWVLTFCAMAQAATFLGMLRGNRLAAHGARWAGMVVGASLLIAGGSQAALGGVVAGLCAAGAALPFAAVFLLLCTRRARRYFGLSCPACQGGVTAADFAFRDARCTRCGRRV